MTTQAQKTKPRLGQLLKSATASNVLLGVMAFFLIDGSLKITSCINPQAWPIKPMQVAYRPWVWWGLRDLEREKQAPDILLLGSSLMMAAFNGGDAALLNVPQNSALHHKSVLFERLLKAHFKRDYDTFVLALCGEMASDAYAITSILFTGPKQPKVIIYGIAPRDFTDSTFPSPDSTEIFKLLSRMGDLSELASDSHSDAWETGEYYLAQGSFFYNHRPDFIYVQHHMAKEAARKICGYKNLDFVKCPLMIRRQAFQDLPETLGPNEVMTLPPSVADTVFIDNSGDYKLKYKDPSHKQFNSQIGYLERLLKLADNQGIKVILVNMPLTKDNEALMPPDLYSNYMVSVEGLSGKYKAQFLDLNNHQIFPKTCFADTVHLNVPGGKHFMEVLVEKIRADDRVAATIQNMPQTGQ